jgi:hypothetical protein
MEFFCGDGGLTGASINNPSSDSSAGRARAIWRTLMRVEIELDFRLELPMAAVGLILLAVRIVTSMM